ncbi:MAG TPA: hypothetical protein PLW95_01365 [bacterium]|nr:hypothetical protein [bacterium]
MNYEKILNLKKLENEFRDFFEQQDNVREETLKLVREIGRSAFKSVKEIHQGKIKEAEEEIENGLKILKKAKKLLSNFPEIYYAGFLHSAEKEIIEALITLYLIRDKKIPEFNKDDFDVKSFLHGLCESTGEIRRYILDKIRSGEIEEIELYLEIIDEIYYFVLEFQYTDALTRGLRRQIDYMRGIVERTRADVTSAIISFRKDEKK